MFLVRPSRAIERGGGFFIPGLEDEKLRIIAALVLIGLSALNLAGVQSQTLSLNVSVTTGIIISLLLFWQGIANTLFSNTWVPAASNSTNSFLTCIQRDPRLPQIEVACISIINSIPDVKSVVVLQVTERIHDETKSMLPLSVLSQWGSLNQSPISLSRLPHEEVCLKQQLFQSPRQIQFYDTINNNSGFLSLLESGGNQQFMEVYIPESQTIWILAKDQVDNKRPIENERDGDFFLSMASIPLGL